MRKTLLFLVALLATMTVEAQTIKPSVGPPSGQCDYTTIMNDYTTGTLYACQQTYGSTAVWLAQGKTQHGTGAPTGSCLQGALYTDDSTGALYSCSLGTWVSATPVGSNTSSNNNALALYTTSGSKAISSDTGAYTDGAGNLTAVSATLSGNASIAGQFYCGGNCFNGPGTAVSSTGITIGLGSKTVVNAGVKQMQVCGTSDQGVFCPPASAETADHLTFVTTLGTNVTSGYGYQITSGPATVTMDSSSGNTYGDCVYPSGSAAGKYTDAGSAICPVGVQGVGYMVSATSSTATQTIYVVPLTTNNHCIEFAVDGNGSAIQTGALGSFPQNRQGAWTITNVTATADQSGSFSLDIWKKAASGGQPQIPAAANKISGTSYQILNSTQANTDSTLSGWTSTSVANLDTFGGTITASSSVQRVTVQICAQ